MSVLNQPIKSPMRRKDTWDYIINFGTLLFYSVKTESILM